MAQPRIVREDVILIIYIYIYGSCVSGSFVIYALYFFFGKCSVIDRNLKNNTVIF